MTLQAASGGDRTIGALAASWTALAILLGSYLAVSHARDVQLHRQADRIHARMMFFAPRVCAARTEHEIRHVIAEMNCVHFADVPNLDNVGEDQMLLFEIETRPIYQAVLDDDVTHDEFVGDFVSRAWYSRVATMERALNVRTFLWVLLGTSTAFALASGSVLGDGTRRLR